MCKTIYTCDHCGKEIIIDDKGIADNGFLEVSVDFYNAPYSIVDGFDICEECAEELIKIMNEYVKSNQKDRQWTF